MRLAISIAATVAGVIPAKAHGAEHCQTAKCNERVARKQCSQKRVIPCIRRAALHWHVPEGLLVRRARCESTLNPYAVNGVHAGLFQFRVAAPSTWATTPYGRRSAYSAKWSSLAAAWMQHVGRGREWACTG